MSDLTPDPRLVADGNGGWIVTTEDGILHILHGGTGWGIYTGPDLELVFTPDGQPVTGVAEPQELIAALLAADDGVINAQAAQASTDEHDDSDGM